MSIINEEEKKAIKILQEEHDVMINPKLEAKYTSDEVIEALYNVIMLVRRQQKEIEEKTTILLAGAEKVKQLEKEIEELIKICDSYKSASDNCAGIFSDTIRPNYISKDKIREKIKELEERIKQEKTITFYCNSNDIARTVISNFKELLEEN